MKGFSIFSFFQKNNFVKHFGLKLKHTAQCAVICNGAEFIEAWHRFEFPATSVRFKSTS